MGAGGLTGTGGITLDNGAAGNALTINQGGNSVFNGEITNFSTVSGGFTKTGGGI
jgi:hypothetical protein